MKASAGHILVVDDNAQNVDLLALRLERENYTVSTARSGPEALQKIEDQEFDAALLDLMMPGMDGIETLRRIRMAHSTTMLPVIMVTAKTGSETTVAAFEAGASDYVRKPIDFRVLSARLCAHIGRKEAETQLRKINTRLEERVRERTRELETKEAHLTALLETIPNGIISIDTNGIIRSMNQTAEAMFGYSTDEAVGQNVTIFMDSPHAENHDAYMKNYLETRQSSGIIGSGARQIEAKRKNGELFPAELSVGELQTDDSHLFVGVVRDITDRVAMEKQLQQSQKLEAVGQLTGGVAHDFNNLLTVIMGNLQLLERTLRDADEKSVQRINKVMTAAKSGADLTRRLLTFSRQQVLETEVIDINELVLGMEDLLKRTMGEHIEIQAVLGEGPHLGRTDRSQLENALLNLCINARDAMPDGGQLTIETTTRSLDEHYTKHHAELSPGDYVVLSVTDTGSGIPDDILPYIFDPFFTTKETDKGTGLGLSTIFGFMKQSGGHINAYSELGLGTTFKLYIPVAENGVNHDQEQSPTNDNKLGSDATVLVVEDDDGVRDFAISVLKDAGFTVIEATNGAEGLNTFMAHPEIDFVFSDVVMPGGMSGPEMVDKILITRPDIPVLFASGYAEQALRNREQLLNKAKLITKPYDADELPNVILKLMEGST